MPIKASAARQIETLVTDLGSARADVREAAVARLTLVGPRAVDRLVLLLDSDAPAAVRVAALRTLEAIADPRALDRVLAALESTEVLVAAAAAAAARVSLRGPRGASVVDRLARVAMDRGRDESVRIAAVRALGDLDSATIAPLLEALRGDPSEAIQTATRLTATLDPVDLIVRAADRGLPEDPADLAEALTRAGARVQLPLLLRVIERVREREAAETGTGRTEWTRVRGRAHVALAERGSRIALYDLRESIEAARAPLPVEFLAALTTAGDTTCLEAIASAYVGATSPAKSNEDQSHWWRDHLAEAFGVIARREGLTRRHAQVKRIEKRWGAALEELWAGRAGAAGKAGGAGGAGRGRRILFAWALLWLSVGAGAQDQTRFQSDIEVTSIDVTAVDRNGRTISDLKAADFSVRVDGIPRRVVTAEWIPKPGTTRAVPSAGTGNLAQPPGRGERLILLVIDQPNIRFGGAITHRAAIIDFIDHLDASDLVGIVNLGGGGESVSFTTDRGQVKTVVSKSVGGVPYATSVKSPGEQTVETLLALMRDLRDIDRPKTFVLVSQGLVFGDVRPSIADLERVAAASRTTIYALRLEERVTNIGREPDTRFQPPAVNQPEALPADNGSSRGAPDTPFPAGPAGDRGPQGIEAAGELSDVATATGGAMFRVTTNATAALERIESAIAGYYLVGVEFAAAEDNGKPHSLRVETSRRGVVVRTRQYLAPAP